MEDAGIQEEIVNGRDHRHMYHMRILDIVQDVFKISIIIQSHFFVLVVDSVLELNVEWVKPT